MNRQDTELGDLTFDGRQWKLRRFLHLLGREAEIVVDAENLTAPRIGPGQRAALELLLSLPASALNGAIQLLWEDYRDFSDHVRPKDTPTIESAAEILSNVSDDTFLIPKHFDTSQRFFFWRGNNEWEVEHGFEVLFQDGVAVHCGPDCDLSMSQEWFLSYLRMTEDEYREKSGLPEPQLPKEPTPEPIQFELF